MYIYQKIKMRKEERIRIRISKEEKEHWQSYCKKKNISLTDLIINAVQKRMRQRKVKALFREMEHWDKEEWKEGYYLNALAKIVNTRKYMLHKEAETFSTLLHQILLKRQEQIHFLQKLSLFLQRENQKVKISKQRKKSNL